MPRTVLFIDYNPRSIGHIRPVLQAMGLQVRLAHDGLTGIDMFHLFSPDMVLLQDLIPLKHGFEVCREIKGTAKGKATPVVLLATLTNGKRREILDIGCDAYLEKPVLDQALIELVRKYIPEIDSMQYATGRADRRALSERHQIPFDVDEEEIDQKLEELMSCERVGKVDVAAGDSGQAVAEVQADRNEPSIDSPPADKLRKAPRKAKTTKKKVTGSTVRKKTARKSKSRKAAKSTGSSPRSKKKSPSKGLIPGGP